MFVPVRGHKIKRIWRGETRLFCAVCRAPVTAYITEVRRIPHAYLISLGRGEHVLDEGVCAGCGTIYGTSPGAMTTASSLAASCNLSGMPLEERSGLEVRVGKGEITPQERSWLLAEPFVALEYELDLRSSTGPQESASAVAVVLLMFMLGGTAVCWWGYAERHEAVWLWWALGCSTATAGLLPWLVWRALTGRHKIASGDIADRIAVSLAALDPTSDELTLVMRELSSRTNAVTSVLNAEDLLGRMRVAR
jgi:hypothetical protein